MARKLSDREDLLAEGVNLPHRGRVTDVGTGRAWIIGWRTHSALSFFDGANFVVQFNTAGILRRVYMDGQKLAAINGRLASLTRRSDAPQRIMHDSQSLSAGEQERVL